MNVLSGSPRVEIKMSVNPEFELRLDRMSIQENEPAAADFTGNRLRIGHARFSIYSEVGEINTGALISLEFSDERSHAEMAWRLVVEPRPALDLLAEAMATVLMAEGGEAIRRHAVRGLRAVGKRSLANANEQGSQGPSVQ